jgi:LCP family protein required for cell wall assembly
LVAFLVAASATAYLTYVAVRDIVKSSPFGDSPPVWFSDEPPTPTPNALGTPAATLDINKPLDASAPVPQEWDGASRVNILIMGLDYGDWSADRDGPSRTDTMIVLTVDPLTKSAGMINLPRDLWVNIPGFEHGKINTAFRLGELYELPSIGPGLPGRGPGLAIQTVEQFLGVKIHFYAQIDFFAFEKFIDEIGGIDIDVPPMTDADGNPVTVFKIDPIGEHNTIKLEPGNQYHFDGPAALAYARARNSQGGDIDRGARQQQVILAIRDKILTLNMLPTLVSKAPILYEQLASGIHTNLTLQQAIALAYLAASIPRDSIKHGVIGPPEQVILATAPDGTSILKPVPDKIRILRDEIFTASGPVSPAAAIDDPNALMQQETARVAVLNATYADGLAAKTTDFLKNEGFNVTVTDSANQLYNTTTIIDYTGKPYTVKYLIQVMGLEGKVEIFSSYDPNKEVDVAVLLGQDWANSNPMP